MKKITTVAEAFDELLQLDTMTKEAGIYLSEYATQPLYNGYKGADWILLFLDAVEPLLDGQAVALSEIKSIRDRIEKLKYLYSPDSYNSDEVVGYVDGIHSKCVELRKLLAETKLFTRNATIEYSEQILSNGITYPRYESFTIES